MDKALPSVLDIENNNNFYKIYKTLKDQHKKCKKKIKNKFKGNKLFYILF